MVTLMNKKLIITLKDAKTGVLHGGAGTFRILIDEEVSGAKHFSLLVNTSNAGTKGTEHGSGNHPHNNYHVSICNHVICYYSWMDTFEFRLKRVEMIIPAIKPIMAPASIKLLRPYMTGC